MRKGFVVTESLVIAVIGLIATFYGGAITQAETNGKITDSINYTVDENKTTVCKEFYTKEEYPKIILTDGEP